MDFLFTIFTFFCLVQVTSRKNYFTKTLYCCAKAARALSGCAKAKKMAGQGGNF